MGWESIESHYAVSGWLTVGARPPTTGHTERQKVHLKTKGHVGWNFYGGTAHPGWHSKDRGMTSLSPMVWQDARAGDLSGGCWYHIPVECKQPRHSKTCRRGSGNYNCIGHCHMECDRQFFIIDPWHFHFPTSMSSCAVQTTNLKRNKWHATLRFSYYCLTPSFTYSCNPWHCANQFRPSIWNATNIVEGYLLQTSLLCALNIVLWTSNLEHRHCRELLHLCSKPAVCFFIIWT